MKQYSQNIAPASDVSEEPTIAPTAVVRDSSLGKWTALGAYTALEESVLDDYSYIDRYSSLIYTEVGKFSSIAAMVRINPGFHPLERPALHHFTYRSRQYGFCETDDEQFFNWRRIQKVRLGHDTWIGHGAVIMPGVTIGNGAVVGSNAVVTKDIPSYAVAVGTPAKVIRYRFPRDVQAAVEKSEWWNWDHDILKERFTDFLDIRTFISKYGGGQ
jgi:phosphonate metabolism protein (transferase hexapeptide repeat family)